MDDATWQLWLSIWPTAPEEPQKEETKWCPGCATDQPWSNWTPHKHRCKTCRNALARDGYRNRGGAPARRDRERFDATRRRSAQRARLRNVLYVCAYLEAHPCMDCGESNITCLEFDHRHSKRGLLTKLYNNCYSLATIQAEIAKCEVVCSNCHAIRTAAQQQTFKHRYLRLKAANERD